MKTFLSDLMILAIGGIGGFFLKYYLDYRWLKSPRLIIKTKLVGSRKAAQVHNISYFGYEIELICHNNSSNVAYAVSIDKLLTFQSFNIESSECILEIPRIDEYSPGKFKVSIYANVTNTGENWDMTADQYFDYIQPPLRFELTYSNVMGKLYEHEVKCVIDRSETGNRKFFVI